MTDTNQEEDILGVQRMNAHELVPIAGIGAASGLISILIYFLLVSVVVPGLFCQDPATSVCASAPTTMNGIALIIGGGSGLYGLIRLRVFRPLLVVLATILAIGGIAQPLSSVPWYWAILSTMLLTMAAYALFSWVAQLRSFIVAALLTVVLTIVTHLVLFS
jgi:hypothetical protein